MGSIPFKEGIVCYYLFQKRLSDYLNQRNYTEDENKINYGYLIHSDWIDNWRKIINYEAIKNFLDYTITINGNNINNCKDEIENYFINNISEEDIIIYLSQIVRTNPFDISQNKIFDEAFLINMIPDNVYKAMKINEKIFKIQIKYIFKKRMVIFAIEELSTIKIIIADTTPYFNNAKVVNLTYKFYEPKIFYEKLNILEKKNSDEIIHYFCCKGIFDNPMFSKKDQNNNFKLLYYLCNEELYPNTFGDEIIFNNDDGYNNDNNKKSSRNKL